MIRPERILGDAYPDEALLARLASVRLADAAIPEGEILQFRRLQSLIYRLRVAGHDVEAMQTEAFVGAALYWQVKCKLAVTRCEYDMEVDDRIAVQVLTRVSPGAVWLTTNATARHPRVHPFPIGVTDYCGYSPYHAVIGDTEAFVRHAAMPRREDNLVLLNFNDGTFPQERKAVRALFSSKAFVTEAQYESNAGGHERYVQGLRSHAFCLAPRGNGIDTHRMWESLYAGCIPVVRRVPALRGFAGLPILFVNRWEDACDADLLRRTRDTMHGREWDLRMLTLSFWYKRALEFLGA